MKLIANVSYFNQNVSQYFVNHNNKPHNSIILIKTDFNLFNLLYFPLLLFKIVFPNSYICILFLNI